VTSRRLHLALLAAACALPRLVVLLVRRDEIVASFTEKSDDFARTFVTSGTYGFIPGQPSAYTQPLYGFFLVPIYELLGRSWASIGLVQIAVAIATAWLVYALGARWLSPVLGLVAGLLATLNPYLVWHDVHVNREILDQLLAAALVLLTLLLVERRSYGLAAAAGVVGGLSILGNSRLAALPLVLVAFALVAWRGRLGRREAGLAATVVVAAVAAVAPWVVRNAVVVGCPVLTTDAKALWKANNEHTWEVLRSGRWIDDVPNLPGSPPTPEMAYGSWVANGELIVVDECAQMRDYQALVLDFWREQPGEKAKLAALGVAMLWDPRTTQTEGSPGNGTLVELARKTLAPLYVLPLLLLAAAGVWLRRDRFAALALVLLGYVTLTAVVFVGATRYRAPWDFLLALLAAAAVHELLARRRRPEPR
jgi:4-amino-4-deoxy-L-arabinose transferase-like glycosyltransferase